MPHGQAPGSGLGPAQIPPAPILPAPRRRRRPILIAAGVMLVVLGGLGAYGLAAHAAQRTAVITLAATVPWGQKITTADVMEADIVTGPGLATMPWASRSQLIGHRAGRDLFAGGLLTPADIMNDEMPPPGKALVGVTLKPGQLPETELTPNQHVLLVPTADTAGANGGGQATPISAIVFAVGAMDAGGARTVDVLVDQSQAPTLATWSAAGAAAIVLVPKG